ncbi:hypothetical protein FDP22_15595 [Paroceanicella profunda]|uniref:Phage gp6-like head-tail connector protein n=2 Tax=Paroceanicella profunda TaxID=2579971 RepID=A0A5B8FZ58_9RHOB|nr:hypothetical protein FDP22_15595 [Paroceanicella profunda]
MLTELEPPVLGTKAVRDLAEHLRLGSGFADDGAQDSLLELYLRTAMAAIEARIGKALIRRSFSWSVTRWRQTGRQVLPVAPVRQVTAVRIISANGAEEEAESSLWVLLPDGQSPALQGSWGRALPGIPDQGRAEIEFDAGYAVSWEELPPDLRQASLLLSASYYENRSADEGRDGAMPFGVLALLDPYRPVRL